MILAIALCVLVVWGLTACSSGNQGGYDPPETTLEEPSVIGSENQEPSPEDQDIHELVIQEPIDPFVEERIYSVDFAFPNSASGIGSTFRADIYTEARGHGESQPLQFMWLNVPTVVEENDLVVPVIVSQASSAENDNNIVDAVHILSWELFEGQELYFDPGFGADLQPVSGNSMEITTPGVTPHRQTWRLVLVWRDYFSGSESPPPIITAEGYVGTGGSFFRTQMGSINLSIENQRFVILDFNYDGHGPINDITESVREWRSEAGSE